MLTGNFRPMSHRSDRFNYSVNKSYANAHGSSATARLATGINSLTALALHAHPRHGGR